MRFAKIGDIVRVLDNADMDFGDYAAGCLGRVKKIESRGVIVEWLEPFHGNERDAERCTLLFNYEYAIEGANE